MNKILVPLLLFISLSSSFGQINLSSSHGKGYIILMDKQKIMYDKFKSEKDALLVTSSEKNEKQRIDIKDVLGYYDQAEGILYYLKPVEASSYGIDYQFIERTISGKINLYKQIVETYSQYGGTNTIYYYIEKSDRFEGIFTPYAIGQNKKGRTEILKSFVSDRPEILKMIGEDFKLNSDNLLGIIKKYNLLTYEYDSAHKGSELGEVIIYRSAKNKASDLIRVEIDGEELVLNSNDDFISIKCKTNVNSRICFDSTDQFCHLVEAIPYFTSYYKLIRDKKSFYSLERSDKKEADSNLETIRLHKYINK
jgi:hypothetical protein